MPRSGVPQLTPLFNRDQYHLVIRNEEAIDEQPPGTIFGGKCMNNHGNICRHCGASMSEPKPIRTGPRKGQTQAVCTKCGHADYLAASVGTVLEMVAGQGIGNFLTPQSVDT